MAPAAERLAFLFLCFMLAFAPLPLASNRPAGWSLLSLLAGAALALWSLSRLAANPGARQSPGAKALWPLLLLLLLLVWFAVQASPWMPQAWHHPVWQQAAQTLQRGLEGALSADPQATVDGILRLAGYGAVFFLAMQFGGSQRYRSLLLRTVAWSGTAYALYGLIVDLGGLDSILWYSRWAYHDSLTSTFVNRNSFATYAGLTLLVLCALTWQTVSRMPTATHGEYGAQLNEIAGRTWPLVLAIILVAMALLLSHSRAGLLVSLLGLAVLLLTGRGKSRRGRRPALLAFAALLAIVAAIGGTETLQRLRSDTLQETGGRLDIYRQVAQGIADRPVAGHGLGSFPAVFPAYRSKVMAGSAVIDKAHDSYLEFAFEAGLPALVLAVGGLLVITWTCFRHAAPEGAAAARIAAASSVLVGSHALLDFSLQIPAVALLYAALLGLGYGAAIQPPAAARP